MTNREKVQSKMKFKIHRIMFLPTLLLFVATIPHISLAQTDYDLLFSYGHPAGFLDYTANVSFSAKFPERYHVTPTIMLQESFSSKKEDDKYGDESSNNYDGHIFYNDITVYVLGLKQKRILNTFLYPYIAGGCGLHLIRSWTTKAANLSNRHHTTLSTKLHAFAGIEIRSKAQFFIFAQGRATFPSDRVFDSFYVGLGLFP
jgi:hypothetical protein